MKSPCHFKVRSDVSPEKKMPMKFPPAISVIVNPPSPSASVKSRRDSDLRFFNSKLRRCSGGSMEKCELWNVWNLLINGIEY